MRGKESTAQCDYKYQYFSTQANSSLGFLNQRPLVRGAPPKVYRKFPAGAHIDKYVQNRSTLTTHEDPSSSSNLAAGALCVLQLTAAPGI